MWEKKKKMEEGNPASSKDAAKSFWLVTVNNPTPRQERWIEEELPLFCSYVCWAREAAPTTGMSHIHVSAALTQHQRGSWWSSKDPERLPGCNLKWTSKGAFKNFVSYVKKHGVYQEQGDLPLPQGKAGSDARSANLEEYRRLAEEGKLREIPEREYRAHYKYYDRVAAEAKAGRCRTDFNEYVEELWEGQTLRPWQQEIVGLLDKKADNRTIVWVYDADGGAGKTALAQRILNQRDDVQVLCPGRSADLAHTVVPGMKMYIFDVPRTQGDYVSWPFIEELKNGSFMKSKYESTMIHMRPPHVVVLANRPPPPSTETSGFSEDRIRLITL